MFNFLKICGMGLLAVLLSPLWIGLLAIVAIFGLLLFVFMLFRVLFLDLHNLCVRDKSKIKDPFGDLPEDMEVKRLLQAQEAVILSQTQMTAPTSYQVERPMNAPEMEPATSLENNSSFTPIQNEEIKNMEFTQADHEQEDFASSNKEGDEQ